MPTRTAPAAPIQKIVQKTNTGLAGNGIREREIDGSCRERNTARAAVTASATPCSAARAGSRASAKTTLGKAAEIAIAHIVLLRQRLFEFVFSTVMLGAAGSAERPRDAAIPHDR